MIDLTPTKLDCVKTVSDLRDIATLAEKDSAATIFQREMPESVRTWLHALPVDQLPHGRVVLRPNMVPDALYHLCDLSNLPPGQARDWFQEDVIALAESFAAFMDAPFLRMRLDVVNNNACRKFHVDTIYARLICTYRGTGTQYGLSKDGEQPRRFFTMQTGCPILLRGNLWPEEPRAGLLHRSPPIEGTGETRLVLVLDPIFDPEGEV